MSWSSVGVPTPVPPTAAARSVALVGVSRDPTRSMIARTEVIAVSMRPTAWSSCEIMRGARKPPRNPPGMPPIRLPVKAPMPPRMPWISEPMPPPGSRSWMLLT
jgi:hypothetical protein